MGPLKSALSRHRRVTVAALCILAMLAWAWTISGAGMDMDAQVEFALFPHKSPGAAMAMAWDPWRVLVTISMWWVMMIAMMVPSAAPTILLYDRAAASDERARPSTGSFVLGYLLVWLAFSIIATLAQLLSETSGLMTSMGMTLTRAWLASGVLILAGLYQFTPLKDRCLAHCRSPAAFLSRHYRPGRYGALRMGAIHGAYCVGCCWALMALLFVGGIMNLVWIAALTLLVAAEKLGPAGKNTSRAIGALLIVWGVATFLA